MNAKPSQRLFKEIYEYQAIGFKSGGSSIPAWTAGEESETIYHCEHGTIDYSASFQFPGYGESWYMTVTNHTLTCSQNKGTVLLRRGPMYQKKFEMTVEENVFWAKRNLVDYIWKGANLEGIAITFPETQTLF